jgi:hypothetical protein
VSANTPKGERAGSASVAAMASASTTRQAEVAKFGDGVNFARRKHPDSDGTRSLELAGKAWVEFQNVDGGAGGPATVEIRYALGDHGDRTAHLIVNGASQKITMASTGDWAKYGTHKETVKLEPGRNNTIRIQANGEPWNVDEITTTPGRPDTTPLPAPTGLTATSGDPGVISLSWNAVAGADSYTIKRGATPGGPYAIVDNVTTGTSYTDIRLGAGTYYYVVSALKNAGESAASGVATASSLVNIAKRAAASSEPEVQPGEDATKAFDGKNTKWFTGGGHATAWLQADLGAGNEAAVVRYDITSANDAPARDPKNWELQASNDGTRWTTLDKRTGEVFGERFQANRYPVNNRTAYRYYRLSLLSNSNGDSSSGFQLAELALLAEKEPANAGKR